MRISQVEVRARKARPAVQSLADLDEQKPEVKDKASIAIREAGAFQLVIRLPTVLWVKIGSPTYVDIIGRATEDGGLKIVKGRAVKVQRERGKVITIALSAFKVGLARKKQTAIEVGVHADKNTIFLDEAPPEWGISLKAVPPPEPLKPAVVLADQSPPPPPVSEALPPVKMAVKRAGNGVGLNFLIPMRLLGHLGDPQRLRVDGTCHQGFYLVPSDDGNKVNYHSCSNKDGSVYLTAGLGGRNISKEMRGWTVLNTEIKDGAIKLGGADREWINAEFPYRPKQTPPPPPAPVKAPPPPVPAPNGNGNGHHVAVPPTRSVLPLANVPTGNTHVETSILKTQLHQHLDAARALLQQLKQQTGIDFKATKDLKIVADL